MSRRKLSSLDDYVRALKNGYGIGSGVDYRPWLEARDVPSRGRSTKFTGLKVPREHHLFSDIERRFLIFAEFEPTVVDIREQFPLFPVDVVYRVAREAGIKHPTSRKNGTPDIRTTDFVLTINDGLETCYLAVAVKPRAELSQPRTMEKLEIERIWWEALDINWRLITDANLERHVARNLEWISDPLRGQKRNSLPCEPIKFVQSCAQALQPGRYEWQGLLDSLADISPFNSTYAGKLLRAAIWERLLEVDLSVPIQQDGILTITKSPEIQEQNSDAVSK